MQKTTAPTTVSSKSTFDLILTSMAIALVFVATLLLNIRLPIAANGGLVHLGTAMLFIIAMLFGPKKAALAGAFGMGLFDLVSGWTAWAPISFIARGLQGYIVGQIAWSASRMGNSKTFNIVGAIASVPVMLAVYYIGEAIIFNNLIIPAASIPGNLVQNAVGLIVAIPVVIALKKVPFFKRDFQK
ncbi:ECF transporter S component [Planomicrobium okeanokoites]|uniref:ECF transporter S component n=1 Tax=Planomicrobium okeanokoites TaxID=244 RepID=UPI0030F8AE49